ncbi:hypothetical protein MYCTH_2298082 [Thermothelomyces thermophilus ATCC 42464]|uniref:HhH-GPD domain-containing protein n=1 Tax=Thermothelomyces thermophilus (strain ATCC 42464 / BCRC 31852 / DSM 1799) TaxID=573729 RepID=G2Q0N9_THET4|nr:uncharacterized protein MYCTH_2298082 [Thermothelomyces thermophilus ATCC 42464]AEO54901.1 hypothetical protein MYCTH_2298082 [Thermothelomyces thermophilus ATCC 42464]
MQTRAAKRKLASAALDVGGKNGPHAAPAEAPQTLVAVGDSESTTRLAASSQVTKGTTKSKRGGKKQPQRVKGGWALPHGMGSEVVNEGASVPQNVLLPETMELLPDLEPSNHSGFVVTGQPDPNAEAHTPKHSRYTRLRVRIAKARAQVRLEEANGRLVNQEGERPRKRVRVTPPIGRTESDIRYLREGELKSNSVKIEDRASLIQPIPKVLIIRGITIKDNVVTRTSGKIIVDASQLLDPNLRRIVKRGKDNPYGLTPGFTPYPYRRVPTPEDCEEVHAILTQLHGEVKQPEKIPAASLEVAGCGEVPCVLDALLRTLISGNTLMSLADAAIKNLADHYGLRQEGTGAGSIDWNKIRLSSHQELAQVIKVAGNGPMKSKHIKQILDIVFDENVQRAMMQDPAPEAGKKAQDLLSLDYMHGMTKDEAMAKFVSYPGVGIKTAACVTLFCLRLPCFAVDTHVHKFCRWLGWVPENADPDNCFRHGDFMVPDHLKYGLHQLFIRHGQVCFKCRKATKPGTRDWNEAPDCPLEHLLDRSKDEAGAKAKQIKKMKGVKEEASSETEDADIEEEVEGE